jgi:hypothetical protein
MKKLGTQAMTHDEQLPKPQPKPEDERLRKAADADFTRALQAAWDAGKYEDMATVADLYCDLHVENAQLKADLATFGKDTVATENRIIDAEFMAQELRAEIEQLRTMVNFADNLRTAQRAYMADRGNDEKGQAVAMAARHYDEARATLAGNKP